MKIVVLNLSASLNILKSMKSLLKIKKLIFSYFYLLYCHYLLTVIKWLVDTKYFNNLVPRLCAYAFERLV